MKFGSGITISRMGIFLGVIASKVNDFFVVFNGCLPTFSRFFHPREQSNTFTAVLIGRYTVGAVLPVSGFSQVFEPIVRPVPVNMVNSFGRHGACDIEPNKSMGGIMFPIDFKVCVSFMVQITSLIANADFWTRMIPKQISCFRVILKNLGKFFMCDHFYVLPGFGKDCKRD